MSKEDKEKLKKYQKNYHEAKKKLWFLVKQHIRYYALVMHY